MLRQVIHVRSDTVTQSAPAMLEAMISATVGDDIFGENESVNALTRWRPSSSRCRPHPFARGAL